MCLPVPQKAIYLFHFDHFVKSLNFGCVLDDPLLAVGCVGGSASLTSAITLADTTLMYQMLRREPNGSRQIGERGGDLVCDLSRSSPGAPVGPQVPT